MPESLRKQLSRNKLVSHDVLMTRSGANYGQTSYYLDEPKEIFACADCLVIRTKQLNGLYLSTFLNSIYGKLIIDRGSYGMAQPHIAPSYLYKIPVPVPSGIFQSKIEKLIKKSYEQKQLAENLYKEAENLLLLELGLLDWKPDTIRFTHGGREFEVEENINKVLMSTAMASNRIDAEFFSPSSAFIMERLNESGCVELSTATNVNSGYPWKSSFFLEAGEDGEPFVRIRNCKPGVIDTDQLDRLEADYSIKLKQPKAKHGDLLVGMDGLKWFYAGLVDAPCYVNQRIAWISPIQSSQFSSEYLLLIINGIIGQTQLLRRMTIADTVGHITNQNIRNLLIPILSKFSHDKITDQVKTSISARTTSRQLLEQAKRAVEIFIEDGEEAALARLGDCL
jgi:restriction endonuclease S subunit